MSSRLVLRAGAALTLLALGGCAADEVLDDVNPVTWYKDLTGADKNKPGPDTPNTANLEQGSKGDFPSLSSVPNEPVRGLTEAQKQALTEGLVADRDHAHYTDQAIRAGDASATMPAQSKVPAEQLPNTQPDVQPVPAPPATTAPPGGGQPTAAQVGGPPPTPTTPVGGSREASLATPTPRSSPTPEAANAPPTPPDMQPLPPPQPEQPVQGAPAAHPEPPPGPEQVAGVPVPQAPPVRPEATPAAGPATAPAPVATPSATSGPLGKYKKSAQVAQITFTGGGTVLPSDAAGKLAQVPALHSQYGGIVRIVGYAIPPQSGADVAGQQLAAYQAGVARADAVKAALVAAGVPAADIVTQASPVQAASASAGVTDRADIYLEY